MRLKQAYSFLRYLNLVCATPLRHRDRDAFVVLYAGFFIAQHPIPVSLTTHTLRAPLAVMVEVIPAQAPGCVKWQGH
jgi:hypothetical protein